MCFAHILNLSTRKALDLPQMGRLLGRVSRIVGFSIAVILPVQHLKQNKSY